MEIQSTGVNAADLSQEYWGGFDFNPDGQPENGGEMMAAELMRRQERYYQFYGSTGLFERDRRSYMSLYGANPDGENVSYRVIRGGDNGQLTLFTPNHYGNILNHMATLVAAKKPGLQGRAENGDADSIQQAKLADAVVDHFQRELDLEGVSRMALTGCLTMRECWAWLRWDADKGDSYIPQPGGQVIKTGGFQLSIHQPGDVIRDVTALGIHDPEWLMVRHFVNKWSLVAQFPDSRDEILNVVRNQSDPYRVEFQTTTIESDLIPIYQFYHKPTPALPSGRQCLLVSNRGLLLDAPLGYDKTIPLIPMMPSQLYMTPFGYSPMMELLSLQQILNALYSGMVTDAIAFAVRRILVPRGQPITATQLQQNLGVLYYDSNMQKPELMQTPLNTEEKLAAIQAIEKLFGTLSGINDVVRGNAENTGVRAASGLALLQAQALQYLSFLEFEYGRFWQRLGNLILTISRDRAKAPLLISVAGKNKKSSLQTFTGNQLPNNYRVSVDLGNPILKTPAGRQTVGDTVLQNGGFGPPGPISTQHYLQFLASGTLEPIMDAETAEIDLIEYENEELMAGNVPPVTIADTDPMHQHDHSIILYSKEARGGPIGPDGNPQNRIFQATMQHLAMHNANQQRKMAMNAPPAPNGPGIRPPDAQGPVGGQNHPPGMGHRGQHAGPGHNPKIPGPKSPLVNNEMPEAVPGIQMAHPPNVPGTTPEG